MNCPVCGHEMIWTYIGSYPVPCMWKCWACGEEASEVQERCATTGTDVKA